ncbi:MAG: leucyl/phenylalanyl-tRNA--protein transferase [Candidatus Kapaibacteriales bacterium]
MLYNGGLGPDMVLMAYQQGYFPMSEGKDGPIFWHNPDYRAIVPLDTEHKRPRSLRQSIKKQDFEFAINFDFDQVIESCSDRSETWISEDIKDTYNKLHNMGFAHSVETYKDGELVGGLYGISIGGAFFGESMFSTVSDASKAAYYLLLDVLKDRGFILLDSQYINPFTAQLGAVEISRKVYIELLHRAIQLPISFV